MLTVIVCMVLIGTFGTRVALKPIVENVWALMATESFNAIVIQNGFSVISHLLFYIQD